jgi:hypothetical protein
MARLTGMSRRIPGGSSWRIAVVGACLVAGAAACSSGASSSSSSSAPAAPTSAASAATAASGTASPSSAGTSTASAFAGSVTNYPGYVGASGPANSSLSPVTIGWVNEQGGPPSETFPQATLAAQATVKYINSQLGGIHGHPVKLATCFIAAVEAQGTTCGDQMVNTKGVEAIAEGLDAVGNASMYGVVNGAIPTLVGVSAARSCARSTRTTRPSRSLTRTCRARCRSARRSRSRPKAPGSRSP